MSKMSEIDMLLQEFYGCVEDRKISEDRMNSCQNRMNEIEEELKLLGFEKEIEGYR